MPTYNYKTEIEAKKLRGETINPRLAEIPFATWLW